jgi:tRNA-specific adenosine deaminase 3
MLNDNSIPPVLGARDPVIGGLLRSEVEKGTVIPLKTAQELREEYVTENILITRAPVKSANPAIS